MSYQVLARKWRPNTFSELVGQEHVVAAITHALDNNRLHHAYLFTGTRGVGKTTIARIFAKSLNCEQGMGSTPCGVCPTCKEIEQGNFVDLLEIDAASRTKVEDTRELLDNVQYKPTRAQYKVYLIDEVHMLSKHSFNALLKTLEEPPPHVKFLLATTDPQKLPITILSRCLQFTLKALTREQIQTQLTFILEKEDLSAESAALHELARAAQGSMRDSLSLTDQAIAQGNGKVTAQVVADMLGLLDRNIVLKLLHAILKKDKYQVLQIVEDLSIQSPDFSQLLGEIMSYFHQIALTQFVPEACKLETHAARAVFTLAKSVPPEHVQLLYQVALQGRKDLPHAVEARIGLEMTLLRMLAFTPDNTMLQSEDVAQVFASLPKMSLARLEDERQQSHNRHASMAANVDRNIEPEGGSTLAEIDKTGEKKTKLDVKDESNAHAVLEAAEPLSHTEPLISQPEPTQETASSIGTSNTDLDTQHSAVQDPVEAEAYSGEPNLDLEQQSLLRQADALRAEAFGEDAHSDAAVDLPAPDPQPPEPQTSDPLISDLKASDPQTSQLRRDPTQSDAEAPESQNASDAPSLEADPQLVDAYTQYLSSMPEDEQDYSESEAFDPASLLDRPVVESASPLLSSDQTGQNRLDPTSPAPTTAAPSVQSNLLNTGDLLALRTQISNKVQQTREQSSDSNDPINQMLKGNTLSARRVTASGKPPQVKPSETNTSLGAQNTKAKNSKKRELAADLPPWETASTRGSATSEPAMSNEGNKDNEVSQTIELTQEPTRVSSPALRHAYGGELPENTEYAEMTQNSAKLSMQPQHKETDFEIPFQLSDGTKVIKASQLDTWSQLIGEMGLSGLTKQVAIHSMYKVQGDTVQLTVAEDKKHLVAPNITQQLAEALSQALQHKVSVALHYGDVTDTPFAVQQAVNRMRMHYAHQTIAADPQVQLLCQTFNAEVNSGSIKPK